MAEWSKDKVLPENINKGKEFDTNDVLTVAELNATVNNAFYAVDFVEGMAETPENLQTNTEDDASVSFVDYEKDGRTFKKFQFKNLKGKRGISILSVEKTATNGLVDTYTINYSDGYTDTFEVTNGADGETGDSIELQLADDYIQWKPTQSATWNNLISIDDFSNVDDSLSSTSTNSVQNNVVTSAITDLQSQIDALPKDGLSVSTESSAFGFCKLSNGLIFQWGTFKLDQANNGLKQITLYCPFTTTSYGIVTSHYTGTISNDYLNSYKIASRTTTYFTVKKHFSETDEYALWIAIGY